MIVNGQPENADAEVTVASLIETHNLQPLRVAVEVNEKLVRRRDFEQTQLQADDRVEIVTFVGGG
ncbi:MAG: sulfur carrier protein ThiS [Planctomycetes bacterium]|nr:sulfur carrier protein ThiS [Planctomycetota bacterium]